MQVRIEHPEKGWLSFEFSDPPEGEVPPQLVIFQGEHFVRNISKENPGQGMVYTFAEPAIIGEG